MMQPPLSLSRPNRPGNQPASGFVHLSDRARSMGVYLLAGKGSGKSRLMGRIIAFQDLVKGIPQVILEPNGPTIDNLLDKVLRLSPDLQARLWPRIRYVEMSGQRGQVTGWPLYYGLGEEGLYEVAQRYLEVVRRLDPHLATASIEGWNAVQRTGTYTGMVLAALGGQITEAEDLLRHPNAWQNGLQRVRQQYPELVPAVDFFIRELPNLKDDLRTRRTASFLNKIGIFRLDPSMQAMFGADQADIDWAEVAAKGQTVLLDFRHELDGERRRFKMLWAFQSFLSFVKWRGAGRHTPVGLIVDELTALYNFDAQGNNTIFAADLDELINVLARNYRVWLTLAHQERFQIDEKSFKTLLGMGTKIVGVTADWEAARELARALVPFDPTRVKQYRPVYAGLPPQVIDLEPVTWSLQEQEYLATFLFRDLRPFHFLVKAAPGEGDITGKLQALSIERVDAGLWPDEARVAQIRRDLAHQEGRTLAEALALCEGRRRTLFAGDSAGAKKRRRKKPVNPTAGDGTLASTHENESDDDLQSLREPL